MKYFVLVISLIISCAGWGRGPVDPILPPWPLRTLPINKVQLTGNWMAVNDGIVWLVQIQFSANGEITSISMKSNASEHHHAEGWLKEQKKGLCGEIVFDGSVQNVILFRDEKGTSLRIADGEGYFDLMLHKIY